MSNTIVCFLLVATALRGNCFKCPSHCFCYTWKGLLKTDCVRRNLFNTFVAFSHQTQVLDLSHNVISILHGNEFLDANLRQLEELRLSNNRLHKIDRLSFNGLQLLKNLDLSFNSIEHLNPYTFKYNTNLKILNVSFNPLNLKKEEPFLSSISSLQVLDMANCHLEFLSSHSFSDLNQLRVLNVSRNYIRAIEMDFLDGMKSLTYLDVSRNDLPCTNQIKPLFQLFVKRNIEFQAFCQTNQKMLMTPVGDSKETNSLEVKVYQKHYKENVTERIPREGIFNDVTQFLQSVPSLYIILGSTQVGIFIGSFSTYFCLRKSIKNYRSNAEQETAGERTRHINRDSDNPAFALISLNIPPGTPPSLYHSRLFPSNFSLSAT